MSKEYHHIFWDWHGVLGTKGFWHKSAKHDQELSRIVAHFFKDKEQVDAWMRGNVSINDLLTSSESKLTRVQLAEYFVQDWQGTDAINAALFSAVHGLYPNAEHMIVTDNMDVFEDYIQTNEFVSANFSRVFSSSEYRTLKDDARSLFEVVLSELELDSFKGCILFDDSETNCKRFESLGGNAVLITRNTA